MSTRCTQLVTLAIALMLTGSPAVATPAQEALRGALQPAVDLVTQSLTPAYTRVLSVQGSKIWFEPAVALWGDRFAIYPEGTILTGPNATSPLPMPIGHATVESLDSEYIFGSLDEVTEDGVPTFAPAARILEERALAVVLQLDESFHPIIADPATTSELYAMLFASVPIPLTSTMPDGADGQIAPHPALTTLPATDVLLIFGGPDFLIASYLTASEFAKDHPDDIDSVTLRMPGAKPTWEYPFREKPQAVIAPREVGGIQQYPTYRAVCDCTWLYRREVAPRLMCITEDGLQGYTWVEGELLGFGGVDVAWAQHPPYRFEALGRIAYIETPEGRELWGHLGHGGHGFRMRPSGDFEVLGPLSGVPIQNDVTGGILLVQTDPSFQQRYTLSGATAIDGLTPAVDGVPKVGRTFRDAVLLESGGNLLMIDSDGALVLLDSSGGEIAKIPGPYGTSLGMDTADLALVATPDGRLARVMVGPTTLTELQRSPKLGGTIIAVLGRSQIDAVDTPVWVLVRANSGATSLVPIGVVEWKGSGRNV